MFYFDLFFYGKQHKELLNYLYCNFAYYNQYDGQD